MVFRLFVRPHSRTSSRAARSRLGSAHETRQGASSSHRRHPTSTSSPSWQEEAFAFPSRSVTTFLNSFVTTFGTSTMASAQTKRITAQRTLHRLNTRKEARAKQLHARCASPPTPDVSDHSGITQGHTQGGIGWKGSGLQAGGEPLLLSSDRTPPDSSLRLPCAVLLPPMGPRWNGRKMPRDRHRPSRAPFVFCWVGMEHMVPPVGLEVKG